jgi:hypothetical protein
VLASLVHNSSSLFLEATSGTVLTKSITVNAELKQASLAQSSELIPALVHYSVNSLCKASFVIPIGYAT